MNLSSHSLMRFVYVLLAVLLLSCGSGSELGSGGTGGGLTPTTPTTQAATVTGPITGFGSVIINGVKFDDSATSIVDRRGSAVARSVLKLGMVVTVNGQIQSDNVTGVANAIVLKSELQGPISSIDKATNQLVVLGVDVMVNANTLYENATSFAELAANDLVEIYGIRNPQTQLITATRIERKPLAGLGGYFVGRVGSNDSVNKTFTLNTSSTPVTVSYASAQLLPATATLSPNAFVFIESTNFTARPIVATRIDVIADFLAPTTGRLEIDSIVSNYTSAASFKLDGFTIDASSAIFARGDPTQITNGVRVEAKGQVVNSVLKADVIKVYLPGASGGGQGSSSGSSSSTTTSSSTTSSSTTSSSSSSGGLGDYIVQFELEGPITAYASVSDFVVQGVKIDATNASFTKGSAADLKLNAKVRVKITNVNSKFVASSVEFR
jgi:Domain of unknown function (DUF5666)